MEKSVFLVQVIGRNFNYVRPWASGDRFRAAGSCFAIKHKSKRYLVTNYHVVENAEYVVIDVNNYMYECRISKTAPEFDLAIIEPIDEKFYDVCVFLEFGQEPRKMDEVMIVGFPMNGNNMSVTRGMISRFECTHFGYGFACLSMQVDVSSAPGSSGGPLLLNGKVVGVHRGRYGIMATVVHMVLLQKLMERKYEAQCSSYLTTMPLTQGAFKKYYNSEQGALVIDIQPANKGKIVMPFEYEDVVTKVNGLPVMSDGRVAVYGDAISFQCYVTTFDPDTEIPVEIVRAGRPMTLKVKFPARTHDVVAFHPKQFRNNYAVVMGLGFIPASAMYSRQLVPSNKEGEVNQYHCYIIETVNNSKFETGFDDKLPGVQEYVMLSEVVPDVRNRNVNVENMRLLEVNGVRVFNIQHLLALCQEAAGKTPFLKFKFTDNYTVVIDISDLKTREKFDAYNIELCRRQLGIDHYYHLV